MKKGFDFKSCKLEPIVDCIMVLSQTGDLGFSLTEWNQKRTRLVYT